MREQLPVLADGVASAGIVDKPDQHYREAARRTVATLGTDESDVAAHLRVLLRSVDNDAARLVQMLAALLPRRDQWLTYLTTGTAEELRAELEGALQRLVDDHLAATAALCPAHLLSEMAPLLRHGAAHAGDSLRAELAPWSTLEQAPRSGPLALAAWRGIAALLLASCAMRWSRSVRPVVASCGISRSSSSSITRNMCP